MAKNNILVIGSRGHRFADCVSWTDDIPYLGDYLVIILNLLTLTQPILKIFGEKSNLILDRLRNEINEIIWVKAQIFCISNSFIDMYSLKNDIFISNYDWSPVKLSVESMQGNKFDRDRIGYLCLVDKWSHFFGNLSNESALANYRKQKRSYSAIAINRLLNNLANKKLAFELSITEYNKDYANHIEDVAKSNKITFLPPPATVSVEEGINFLVNEIMGIKEKEIKLPAWATEIVRFNKEKELQERINYNNTSLTEISNKLENDEKELNQITRFKGLLTEDGETLECIVEEAFALFGIKLERVEGNKEDRIFRFDEDIIPIEIKGKTASIPERDGLNQLIGRLKYDPPKNFKTHGILIGNHYKNIPLNEKLEGRKRAFEPDVVEKAKVFNCCLISTLEIFKFVDRKLFGENVDSEAMSRLFNTIGLGIDNKEK